jgi:ribosomal protein S18 acetylase RimI-like enzyme
MNLPPGFTSRGASAGDIARIAQLIRTSEAFDDGEPSVSVEDVESDWLSPRFDPNLDALIISDGDDFVGYGEVPGWRAEATVHPEWRGRGIGTELLAWVERRAAARPNDAEEIRVGQTVKNTNTGAIELFIRHAYSVRHTSWVLRFPQGVAIAPAPLPSDLMVRPADLPAEERQVYQVVEDAFNEWPTRTPSTFEEWQAHVILRGDFDPSLLLVAATAVQEVVGVAFCIQYPEEGWIQTLAVRADRRGEGIAKALLAASYATLGEAGSTDIGLSTDSRTGALDLYTNLGMVVGSTYEHYSKIVT